MKDSSPPEKDALGVRLAHFRFLLLLPISSALAIVMTLGLVISFSDGTLAGYYYLPIVSVVGAWTSVVIAIRRKRMVLGFFFLSVSLLVVLFGFPFLGESPVEVYESYALFIFAAYILLIGLSGLFGAFGVTIAAAALYFVQVVSIGLLGGIGLRVIASSNFVLPILCVGISSYAAIRYRFLIGVMVKELLETNGERKRLETLSTRDPLTGLYNRRFIESLLGTECDRVTRYGGVMSCLMIDADEFKKINDTYGHQVGDDILCSVSKILGEKSRKSDVCARYGGEEFIVLTPNDKDLAIVLAERLRKSISETSISNNGDSIGVTVSIGVASHEGGGECVTELVRRADTALYQAKMNGRNRVMIDEAVADR